MSAYESMFRKPVHNYEEEGVLNFSAHLAKGYLRGFPMEKGKWRLWTLIHPHLGADSFRSGWHRTGFDFEMELNSSHYIERFIYYWGLWEPDETHFITRVLKPGDSFVDVGANIGFFTLLASRLVGKAGRVHAFEPVPSTAECLRRNVQKNGCTNVMIHQCAVTNTETTIRINKFGSGDSSDQNSMRPSSGSTDHWEVRGCRIDSLVSTNTPVRIIKMDVEGAEFGALQGASELLSRPDGPIVLCEVTDSFLRQLGSSAAEVYVLMADYGYRFAYDCHNRKLTPLHDHLKSQDVFQRNVVFSKQSLS